VSSLSTQHSVLMMNAEIDPESTLLVAQAGAHVAKLTGTGYARRIIDLHRSNPFLKHYEESVPESW